MQEECSSKCLQMGTLAKAYYSPITPPRFSHEPRSIADLGKSIPRLMEYADPLHVKKTAKDLI